METTLNTSAELLRQIGYLADDENSLKKLLAYTKKLVTKKREAEEEPVQTKEEILADFAEACRELKLHREGKKELLNFRLYSEKNSRGLQRNIAHFLSIWTN